MHVACDVDTSPLSPRECTWSWGPHTWEANFLPQGSVSLLCLRLIFDPYRTTKYWRAEELRSQGPPSNNRGWDLVGKCAKLPILQRDSPGLLHVVSESVSHKAEPQLHAAIACSLHKLFWLFFFLSPSFPLHWLGSPSKVHFLEEFKLSNVLIQNERWV